MKTKLEIIRVEAGKTTQRVLHDLRDYGSLDWQQGNEGYGDVGLRALKNSEDIMVVHLLFFTSGGGRVGAM